MKCLIHPDCKATVKVNNVTLCWECWNKANTEEREWFKKATDLYNHGLITKKELDDYLFSIGYHEVDPELPVHLKSY